MHFTMVITVAFVILLNLLFACKGNGLKTLTCTNYKFCSCVGNHLLCNITDANFVLPSNISLGEAIESMTIQGDGYSVNIPDKYYSESWSILKSFELIGSSSRNRLSLPLNFTQALKNLTIFRIRSSNLCDIERYAFSFLNHIVEIDISNNGKLHVTEVEKGLHNFSSETIKTFNISGIHNAENMEEFAVSGNLLSPLGSVRVFDISWTRASKLLSSFNLMPNLVSINMSGTILLGPALCFSSLVSLQNLEFFTMDHWPKLARDDGLSDHKTL